MYWLLAIALLGQTTVRDGVWSDPAIWDQVPTRDSDVTIQHAVTLGESITVRTITIAESGALQIGTEEKPASLTVTFSSSPIDTAKDPTQLGHGLISYGRLRVHGVPKTAHARITAELKGSDTTLRLAENVKDWQPGDVIYIPDTRQPNGPFNPASKELRDEFRKIKEIRDTEITLDRPLTYPHSGAHDADDKLMFLPAIANLTRSVVFRSEDPTGTRAHSFFNEQADIWLKYAAFLDMGRTTGKPLDSTKISESGKIEKIGTNQIGRYPVHFHHCAGPMRSGKHEAQQNKSEASEEYAFEQPEKGKPVVEATPAKATQVPAADITPAKPVKLLSPYQFECIGNVVWSQTPATRWGITVHQSHYGLIADNVVVTCAGSGIVTEDGNETANIFENNYVSHVTGEGRPDARQNEIGFEGSAYWFRGGNNVVRNNLAYDAKDGFIYYARYARKEFRYPTSPGGVGSFPIDPTHVPIKEFVGNEVCGCWVGFSSWWIGAIDRTPIDKIGPSIVRNLTCWNTRGPVSGYESANFRFINLVAIGDKRLSDDANGGWGASDYIQYRTVIEGGRIENYNSGIRVPSICDRLDATGTNPGLFVIRGIRLRNRQNLSVPVPWHNARALGLPPITVHMENVTMEPLVNGPDHKNIRIGIRAADFSHYTQWVNVWSHGDTHRRYYGKNQEPNETIPKTSSDGKVLGAPEPITNAVAWERFGFASGGELAPANAQRAADIEGSFVDVDGKKPYIWPVPNFFMAPGQSLRTSICAYNPSLGELDYRVVKGPDGMAIENRSGLINWHAPDTAGEYPVTLAAQDADAPENYAEISFVITIAEPQSPAGE